MPRKRREELKKKRNETRSHQRIIEKQFKKDNEKKKAGKVGRAKEIEKI